MARALLHNLRDQDYGKTLSDIRAAFYSAPRLPLPYHGDRDLQQAIYDAVHEVLLSVVDAAGTEVAVTAPGQVNLTGTGLRIAKPPPLPAGVGTPDEHRSRRRPTKVLQARSAAPPRCATPAAAQRQALR